LGTPVEVALDWERRYAHMRMHTCLHLLSALFRDAAVTGGQVGAEKSRLDFDIPAGTQLEKDAVTAELNRLIKEGHAVSESFITDEELLAKPELVRTMSVKPPMGHGRVRLLAIGNNVDLQPCGGTHVGNTAEIGAVEVLKIENKGKQNRRIVVGFKRLEP
jgi:misacylated tRNA(Ala) deacylase